jgi:hypothetical protein
VLITVWEGFEITYLVGIVISKYQQHSAGGVKFRTGVYSAGTKRG